MGGPAIAHKPFAAGLAVSVRRVLGARLTSAGGGDSLPGERRERA